MNLIIITGCPGCGKTEISKFLAEKLDYPVISKDYYKNILFEKYGFNTAEEKKKLDLQAEEMFFEYIKKKH